jgi:chemotaxis response regulator CheB
MLVDDHYLVRAGLANVLGFEPDIEVCAQAESGDEALALYRLHDPDVTLMDLRMAGTDGLAALAALRRECPGARVIILSAGRIVAEREVADLRGGDRESLEDVFLTATHQDDYASTAQEILSVMRA